MSLANLDSRPNKIEIYSAVNKIRLRAPGQYHLAASFEYLSTGVLADSSIAARGRTTSLYLLSLPLLLLDLDISLIPSDPILQVPRNLSASCLWLE
jgi:hypothetical protein